MAAHRACGACTACCTVLPVVELGKQANQRCKHARFGKGCAIYARAPASCRLWSCRWLVNDDAGDLRRPDRSGIIVDIMEDIVGAQDNATGETTEMPVLQCWVDPARPEAHREPGFRAFVEREGMPALIRFGSSNAMLVVPPALTDGQGWLEYPTQGTNPDFKSAATRMHEAVERQRAAEGAGP